MNSKCCVQLYGFTSVPLIRDKPTNQRTCPYDSRVDVPVPNDSMIPKKWIREVDMCNKTNKDFYGTRPKSKIELKRDNIEREKKKQEIWERKWHKGLVDSIRIIYTPMGGKPRK